MGERVSNKQVLEALNSGFDRLITAMTASAIAPAGSKTGGVDNNAEGGEIEVDEKYLAHMTLKAAEHATAKGEDVVLYARKNKAGTTKLAYALRARFDDVVAKQPSCLGPVGEFKA